MEWYFYHTTLSVFLMGWLVRKKWVFFLSALMHIPHRTAITVHMTQLMNCSSAVTFSLQKIYHIMDSTSVLGIVITGFMFTWLLFVCSWTKLDYILAFSTIRLIGCYRKWAVLLWQPVYFTNQSEVHFEIKHIFFMSQGAANCHSLFQLLSAVFLVLN